jgi:arginase
MRTSRRKFIAMANLALLASTRIGWSAAPPSPVSLVLAPSNLGLRPNTDGSQPGTWRAPRTLLDAGLADAIGTEDIVSLARPSYVPTAADGTRIRNGNAIREFSLTLAETVRGLVTRDRFPVVVGGDCSILLGSLYGLRLAGGRGLVHVDAHSDFSHPGNYDAKNILGAAAGMDLALASGRGESLLTQWPNIGTLANDDDIVQVGERDAQDPAFMTYYGDILKTKITMFTTQQVLANGIAVTARDVISRLTERDLDRTWVHVDFDVLDERVMPAVDSPGKPGFDFAQLSTLVRALCTSGRVAGVTFAIYDPDRDPGTRYAKPLVTCIADAVRDVPTHRGVAA